MVIDDVASQSTGCTRGRWPDIATPHDRPANRGRGPDYRRGVRAIDQGFIRFLIQADFRKRMIEIQFVLFVFHVLRALVRTDNRVDNHVAILVHDLCRLVLEIEIIVDLARIELVLHIAVGLVDIMREMAIHAARVHNDIVPDHGFSR